MNEKAHRDLMDKAIDLAVKSHAGQVDKAGEAYISHPARVVGILVREIIVGGMDRQDDHRTHLLITGWLHDVVEDSDVTLEQIRETFGDEIAEAVDAITHRKNEPLDEYYRRVKANPVALTVKLCDIDDNTSDYRMDKLPMDVQVKLILKYAKALTALMS